MIGFFIDLCIPILIDDWFDMHLFDVVGDVRIVSFAHQTIDLLLHLCLLGLFDVVSTEVLVLKAAFELLLATRVVIDCLDGPFRRKVRSINVLYTLWSFYCAPSFNFS